MGMWSRVTWFMPVVHIFIHVVSFTAILGWDHLLCIAIWYVNKASNEHKKQRRKKAHSQHMIRGIEYNTVGICNEAQQDILDIKRIAIKILVCSNSVVCYGFIHMEPLHWREKVNEREPTGARINSIRFQHVWIEAHVKLWMTLYAVCFPGARKLAEWGRWGGGRMWWRWWLRNIRAWLYRIYPQRLWIGRELWKKTDEQMNWKKRKRKWK